MRSAAESYVYVKAEGDEVTSAGAWITPKTPCSGCWRAKSNRNGDLACFLRLLRDGTGSRNWRAFLLGGTKESLQGFFSVWRREQCKETGWHGQCCHPHEETTWRQEPDLVVLSRKAIQGHSWAPVVAHLDGVTKHLYDLVRMLREKKRASLSRLPDDLGEKLTELCLGAIYDAQGDRIKGAYVCVAIVGGVDDTHAVLSQLDELRPVVDVLLVKGEADLGQLSPYLRKRVAMRQISQQFWLSDKGLELMDRGAVGYEQGSKP